MKLQRWALIAEIVSGIAVVVTLIFLIFGIRENSEITRAAAYERNIDSFNEWRMWVSEDEDRLRLYDAFLQGQTAGLTDFERMRTGYIVNALWAIYEKSFYSNQYGILGPAEWARTDAQLCQMQNRMEPAAWENMITRLTKEFADYVSMKCLRDQ